MSKEQLIQKSRYTFDDLVEVMRLLRAPDGCPWDAEQTHQSIRDNFIEETYEVVEGIDTNNNEIMCEELGDVLLQVVFHAQISQDENAFTLDDVITGVCKKLILRHPHIFSNVQVKDSAEVLQNWDEIKKKEKGQKTPAQVVSSVSSALPALMRAQKLQEKAQKNDLLTLDAGALCEQVQQEAAALQQAVLAGQSEQICCSLGKMLFDLSAVAATQKMNAEHVLFDKNENFCKNLAKK